MSMASEVGNPVNVLGAGSSEDRGDRAKLVRLCSLHLSLSLCVCISPCGVSCLSVSECDCVYFFVCQSVSLCVCVCLCLCLCLCLLSVFKCPCLCLCAVSCCVCPQLPFFALPVQHCGRHGGGRPRQNYTWPQGNGVCSAFVFVLHSLACWTVCTLTLCHFV